MRRWNLGHGLDGFVLDNLLTPAECRHLIAACEHTGKFSFWDRRPGATRTFRNAETIEMMDDGDVLSGQLWSRMRPFLLEERDDEDGSGSGSGSGAKEEGERRFGAVLHVRQPDEEEEREDAAEGQHIDAEAPSSVPTAAAAGQLRHQCDTEGTWRAMGTNPHILFAKYESGGHFAPHTDGYSIVDFNHRSMYSIVLFLNTCRVGGGTRFYADAQKRNLVKDAAGRWTGQAEHVLLTVPAQAGRCLVFFHQHMHEGVPPGDGEHKVIIRSDVMYRRDTPVCDAPKDREAFALYQQANAASGEKARDLFARCFRMSPALAEIYGM